MNGLVESYGSICVIRGQMVAADGGLLTGFGEDLRVVLCIRTEALKAAHKAKK